MGTKGLHSIITIKKSANCAQKLGFYGLQLNIMYKNIYVFWEIDQGLGT